MYVTNEDVEAMKRILFRKAPREDANRPLDFTIRPISLSWRANDRQAAYKTATANACYIMRDDTPTDRYGAMPHAFAMRRAELRCGGLMLPGSAPKWAEEPYRIWQEADAATDATNDITAVSAWHVLMEIPKILPQHEWRSLVMTFVERELVAKGAAVQWGLHAIEGDDGDWIVAPHSHLILSARKWRHGAGHGDRHAAWAGWWGGQQRLAAAWRRHARQSIATARLARR